MYCCMWQIYAVFCKKNVDYDFLTEFSTSYAQRGGRCFDRLSNHVAKKNPAFVDRIVQDKLNLSQRNFSTFIDCKN